MPTLAPKFPLGVVVATHLVDSHCQQGFNLMSILKRFSQRDWGDTCPEDATLNDEAIDFGNRILAVYEVNYKSTVDATTILFTLWVINEADRSSTTFLLPEEY